MVIIIIGEVSVVFHIAKKNAQQKHGADLTGIKDIIAVKMQILAKISINPILVVGNNAKLNLKIFHAITEII